jgi:hypothetical protein
MSEGSKLRGRVHVRVSGNITLENLNRIVAQVGGLAGCTHCGILGIDLILSGDPVESQQLSKLQGVQSVSFGQ